MLKRSKMFRAPTVNADEDFIENNNSKYILNVVGSLIYEEPATGDYSLNFYTAKLRQDSDDEPSLH